MTKTKKFLRLLVIIVIVSLFYLSPYGIKAYPIPIDSPKSFSIEKPDNIQIKFLGIGEYIYDKSIISKGKDYIVGIYDDGVAKYTIWKYLISEFSGGKDFPPIRMYHVNNDKVYLYFKPGTWCCSEKDGYWELQKETGELINYIDVGQHCREEAAVKEPKTNKIFGLDVNKMAKCVKSDSDFEKIDKMFDWKTLDTNRVNIHKKFSLFGKEFYLYRKF